MPVFSSLVSKCWMMLYLLKKKIKKFHQLETSCLISYIEEINSFNSLKGNYGQTVVVLLSSFSFLFFTIA